MWNAGRMAQHQDDAAVTLHSEKVGGFRCFGVRSGLLLGPLVDPISTVTALQDFCDRMTPANCAPARVTTVQRV